MFWLTTILATAIFGLKINAQAVPPSSNYTLVTIQPNGPWWQFNFGKVGVPPFVLLRFTIGLLEGNDVGVEQVSDNGNNDFGGRDGGRDGDHGFGRKCFLEITDGFCPGDRFELIKLGTDGLAPETILITPKVPFDRQIATEICDGFPVQCPKSTRDPEIAFNDPTWSSGKVPLDSGTYSIVIKAISSPYCSGAGFVRVRCYGHPRPPHPPPPPPRPRPDSICKYSEGGFHMVVKPVQGPMAGGVCGALGMKLAEIDNSNFDASTNVAFKCSGPLSTSWIGAWNGQTWAGQEGLGLTVSTASPGGSINVYNDGQARNVLCQEM